MYTKFSFIIILLLIFSGCSSKPNLDLYNQSINKAKSALHNKEFDSAIELLESALIERSDDTEANRLLEMAKDKKTQLVRAKKIKDDLQLLDEQFNEFLLIYSSDFFKEMPIAESVRYLELGMQRQSRLEQILTKVLSLVVYNELIALKDDFEEVINQEIEATMSSMVINLLIDTDHSDPSADPLNQFGEAMDSWRSSRDINYKMVPILQNRFRTAKE